MPANTVETLRLPSESSKAPRDAGGIYFFRLTFPTDYELGLTTKGPLAPNEISTLIARSLEAIISVLHTETLVGTLRNKPIGLHLRTTYMLDGHTVNNASLDDILSLLSDIHITPHATKSVTSLIREVVNQTPPLYVGMTANQSLFDRLTQHLSGETDLSQKIQQSPLSWSDLQYSYMSVLAPEPDRMRALERLAQTICRPKLSSI